MEKNNEIKPCKYDDSIHHTTENCIYNQKFMKLDKCDDKCDYCNSSEHYTIDCPHSIFTNKD